MLGKLGHIAAIPSKFCFDFLAVIDTTVISHPNTEVERDKLSRVCLTKTFELLWQNRTHKSSQI